MKHKTRVLIADDHPLLREALSQLFSSQNDMEVVGEASDGIEATEMAERLQPDVVIIDIMMPQCDGLEASKRIKSIGPNIAILILTAYDDDNYVLGLLETGAAGYLLKSARGEELVEAVRAIQAGESVLHPNIVKKLLKRAGSQPAKPDERHIDNNLTEREMEILKYLARGMSNKEIASDTYLSLRTVKTHMSNIFMKLNVASRSEALTRALRMGLLTMDDVRQ